MISVGIQGLYMFDGVARCCLSVCDIVGHSLTREGDVGAALLGL